MRLLPATSLTLALLLTTPAFAQQGAAQSGSDDDFHTDQGIVVTAPYVRSLDILGNVSVMQGEKLAQDIRGQIGDTLASQPGVPWTVALEAGEIREVGLLVAPQALAQLAGAQGLDFHARLQAQGAFALHAADPATLRAAHDLAALLLGQEPGGALLREAKSLELLARVMQCHGDAGAAVPAAARRRLLHARALLLADPARAPSIDALARACGMNSFSLKRGFKALFGLPLHALHQHERMRLAWHLIESGAMGVTEAGEHVGYASLGHFSLAFKKQFGLLPSELKRRAAVRVQ